MGPQLSTLRSSRGSNDSASHAPNLTFTLTPERLALVFLGTKPQRLSLLEVLEQYLGLAVRLTHTLCGNTQGMSPFCSSLALALPVNPGPEALEARPRPSRASRDVTPPGGSLGHFLRTMHSPARV